MAGRPDRDRDEADTPLAGIRFDPAAASELTEAAAWYESRHSGLGGRLLDEVERLLAALAARPESFPRVRGLAPELGVRRALLPRFPFGLIFLSLPREIRVIAVAHARREPDYWLNRVADESG